MNFTIVGQTPPTPLTGPFVKLRVPAEPPPLIQSVVNSASLQPVLAPGALVSIFGSNLTGPTQSTTYGDTGSYPTSVASTSVTFNGVAASLLYVSPTQINAIVPFSLAGQTSLQVAVQRFERVSASVTGRCRILRPRSLPRRKEETAKGPFYSELPMDPLVTTAQTIPRQQGRF
jgi:uncharacterized protein (TIGR03437 family)